MSLSGYRMIFSFEKQIGDEEGVFHFLTQIVIWKQEHPSHYLSFPHSIVLTHIFKSLISPNLLPKQIEPKRHFHNLQHDPTSKNHQFCSTTNKQDFDHNRKSFNFLLFPSLRAFSPFSPISLSFLSWLFINSYQYHHPMTSC